MSIFSFIQNFYVQKNSSRFIKYLRHKGVLIGDNVKFLNPKSNVVDLTRPHLLSIGNNVRITHGVILLTHGYEWFVLKNMYGFEYGSAGELNIGDNVFIGMNSILLKNVNIGSNVIIGAGSVISKNIPHKTVAAGNPAKIICTIDEFQEKIKKRQLKEAKVDIKAFRRRHLRDPYEEEIKEFSFIYSSSDSRFPYSSFDEFIQDCKY